MQKLDQLYEGKAKILYQTDDPDVLIQYFKDDATAFNAQKKGTIADKGVMNNQISSKIFQYLTENGIPSHYMDTLNDREMTVKHTEIIPVEVIVRNRIAGSLARLLKVEEGGDLAHPLIEYSYKKDELGDPMLSDKHIVALSIAAQEDLDAIDALTYKINDLMVKFFHDVGIELVDFKLEFGKHKGQIILADEISPDTCRLWDKTTGDKMDKDRFRHDLGHVEESYQEVLKRVTSR